MGRGSRVHRPTRSARRLALALVALAVLLLHARLLSGIGLRDTAGPAAVTASPQPAIEFRTLTAPVAQRVDLPRTPPMVDRAEITTLAAIDRVVMPKRRSTALTAPVAPQPEPEVASTAAPVDVVSAGTTYRTEIAPSMQLRYRVERGERIGSAVLNWQVLDGAYEAGLDIVYEGPRRLTLRRVNQLSHGRIDATGVAPERHTDRRPRAGMRAVNFERDAGEVSFSGPSWRLPLGAGAQDGLSWMLQLAAVAQAEPERASAGGEIVLTVVGVRGEARPWRFRFEAVEPLQLGEGVVATAKWVRETAEPYDARLEVWLDPARHHLPVRLRSGAAGTNGAFEMVLVE